MTEILYLDRDFLISVKPVGLLSEGEGAEHFPTLLADELRRRGESPALYPVHRLDRTTEGLMVYGRTPQGAAALSRAIADGNMKKEYLAVIYGVPKETEGTLRDLMFYDRAKGKSYLVNRPRKGVKEAILDYRLLATREGFSLLRIRLHTGRTHQIRVQLGGRGLPLCGDRRYGAPPSPYSMGLCSARLSFPHPRSGGEVAVTYVPKPEVSPSSPWRLFEDLLEESLFAP